LSLTTPTTPPEQRGGIRRPWHRLAAGLLITSALAGQPALAETDHDIQAQRLAELRSQIRKLQERLDQVQGEQNRLQIQLRQTERAITRSSLKLRSVKRKLGRAEQKKRGLTLERRQLEKTLTRQRRQLADQLRAAYATGRQERLKLLLNQQSPATVGRLLVYYQHLNQARSELIDTVKTNVARLAQLEYELAEQTEKLHALNAEQERRNRQLAEERRQRKTVLAELNREAQDKQGRLSQYQADEQRLQELLKALDLALADIPERQRHPFHSLKGKLQWPAQGRLAARFGSPRATGKLRWNGVLIEAGAGDEVHAISHGRVAFADWLRGFGLLIIIDHDDGYLSLYGHNQTLFKEPGDWVESGELIAEVGDSGGQARHGLYFEIRKNGRPVNPLGWCKRPRHNRVGRYLEASPPREAAG
jgi:septal ring factor EnvC (AmiA/AmiB activator)